VIRWESMMSIESEHEVADPGRRQPYDTRADVCVRSLYHPDYVVSRSPRGRLRALESSFPPRGRGFGYCFSPEDDDQLGADGSRH
jgi:hypothetical protein